MGSITPYGKHGAEPTSIMVFSSIRASMAATSARKSGPTGARRISRSMSRAALSKAGCRDSGATMLPRKPGLPRCSRVQSRQVWTAWMMLSVPPVVMMPRPDSGAWNRSSAMSSTSSSMRRTLWKARLAPNAFSEKYSKKASRPTSWAWSSPLKTNNGARPCAQSMSPALKLRRSDRTSSRARPCAAILVRMGITRLSCEPRGRGVDKRIGG